MVSCKTKGEIELMRQAGQVLGRLLEELEKNTRPGITTLELDEIAGDFIRSNDCTPAFYKLYDFPRNICISLNDEVVHGIPSKRALKEGDIITYDVGATYKGWNADCAATFGVGKISDEAQKLLRVTREALMIGIDQMRIGNHLYDISAAVNDHVNKNGFGILKDYGGHGIGRKVHEDPHLPNRRQPVRGMALRKGLCLACEPLVTVGSPEVYVKPDKWTVSTKDGKLSAQFEHSIAVTDGDPFILTTA
ncbi:MAG TPA: type I methionyl aminopeptidase [Chloroflexia bacterium]|nr:type I methionyl aminopeptidase [Chloroflexia bacterium]